MSGSAAMKTGASRTLAYSYNKRLLLVGAGIPLLYQVTFTVFGYTAPETLLPPWGWLLLHGLTDALFIVCPLVALGPPLIAAWKSIGGRTLPWLDCLLAVLLGGLCISLFQVVYTVITSLMFHLSAPDFGYTQSAQDVLLFFVWAVLLGPLGEEAFFRGFFGYLLPKPWQFLLVSSVLWTALHVDPLSTVPLLFTGAVLAFIRIKTRSFYPALILHIVINLLALLLHFLA